MRKGLLVIAALLVLAPQPLTFSEEPDQTSRSTRYSCATSAVSNGPTRRLEIPEAFARNLGRLQPSRAGRNQSSRPQARDNDRGVTRVEPRKPSRAAPPDDSNISGVRPNPRRPIQPVEPHQ